MFNQRVMSALNDLIVNAQEAPNETGFVVASQGQPGKGQNKAVICTSTEPLIMNLLLVLREGLEYLNNDKDFNRIDLINAIQQTLNLIYSMLEVEKQTKPIC